MLMPAGMLLLSACTDVITEPRSDIIPDADSDEYYWHTGLRTRAQELELKRKYGLGFSYDAVYGSKCDTRYVKCQALDIGMLEQDGLLYTRRQNEMRDTCAICHSFSEYCHAVNLTGSVSGNLLLYAADYSRVASLYEHALDTVTYISNRCKVSKRYHTVRSDIAEYIADEPERYLTPSFRYALRKIAATPKENVIVVDSFINLFGTHIVTDVSIGAELALDVKVRRGVLVDYKSEEIVTREKLNLLFTKKTSTSSKEEKEFMRYLLNSSSIDLKVKGGNVSIFDNLVTNPVASNPDATEETVAGWMSTLKDDEDAAGSGNLVLVDMEVSPIWDFIPDKEVALRVKTRIIADAPGMQELYGNLNWINTEIDLNSMSEIGSYLKCANKYGANPGWWWFTFKDPAVVNVIAANRIVASVCREWVPELNPDEPVVVAYPVYDNRIDITSGLHVDADGTAYSVSWRYDRFKVTKLAEGNGRFAGKLYVNFGRIETQPVAGQQYEPGHPLIGYEYPGGINVETGESTYTGFVTVVKFLGDFYLDNASRYSNLPNWHWADTYANPNAIEYYKGLLEQYNPYSSVGIALPGRSGIDNLKGRMIRNSDYRYVLNRDEGWYEFVDED